MIISSSKELEAYRSLAKLSTSILKQLHQAIAIGVTPLEIDQLADKLCQEHQVEPAFKGVGQVGNLYKHTTCISVNETVVHGIPNNRPFVKGDVIKVDFGIKKAFNGIGLLITDHCFTVGLAPLFANDERLIKSARNAVANAAKLAVAGKKTGELGFIQESTVTRDGFNVAKGFIGHGIGHTMHDGPQLPAYGPKRTGEPLQEGMVLCIESQIIAGEDDLYVADDGWSIKTHDGSKAAMFEVMVVVGKTRPIILTPTLDWKVMV